MTNEAIDWELKYQQGELRSLDCAINDLAESLVSRLRHIASRIDIEVNDEREDFHTAQQLATMERMLMQRIHLSRHIRNLEMQGAVTPVILY